MGFVGDIVSNVGHVLGVGGGMNQYNAATPTSDFQAHEADLDKNNFADAIQQAKAAATAGQGQANTTAGQQGALADALRAQAAGNGPSVAQNQLAQATDQNQQMAAGMLASQRGLNPGLAARQILNQRANMQQNAAGQAATLRSQEQLGAQGLLAQALSAQRGQDISQQGANTSLLSTAGGLQQGQNALALQNSIDAQQLNQQTKAQNAQNQLGAEQINAGVAGQNANITSSAIGGLMNSGAAAAKVLAASSGGEVPSTFALRDPESYIGLSAGPAPDMSAFGGLGAALGKKLSDGIINMKATAGGYNPDQIAGSGIAHGGQIPGTAQTAGDDPSNDTVPAMLSPKEIVLPRSVTLAEDAPEKARAFVEAIRARHGKPASSGGYGEVLERLRRVKKAA